LIYSFCLEGEKEEEKKLVNVRFKTWRRVGQFFPIRRWCQAAQTE
jgi:hypothetical protein